MLHLGEEDEEEEEENVWILSISLVLTDYLQFVHNGEAAKVGVELPHSFHLLLLVHLHKRQRKEGKINPQRFHKNKMLLIRVLGEMITDLQTAVIVVPVSLWQTPLCSHGPYQVGQLKL